MRCTINLQYGTITRNFESYLAFKAYMLDLENQGRKVLSYSINPIYE